MNWIDVMVEYSALEQTFTYQCPYSVQVGCRVQVPFGSRLVTGLVTKVHDECPKTGYALKEIKKVLDTEPLLNPELFELAGYVAQKTATPLMGVFQAMLPSSYKPSSASSAPVFEDWLVLSEKSREASLTPRLRETLESLPLPMKASAARKQAGAYRIRALLDKGALKTESRQKEYQLLPSLSKAAWPALTSQQQEAVEFIEDSEKTAFLLHGVTGSGKTEVFFHLAQKQLDLGKQVLLLVPEIGLTPMMIHRVVSRFDVPVMVYHSRLSASEAASQYQAVKHMKKGIVIGTRSACFLPFDNLGLIIMDEEHDASYKQDRMPKYHTRDVALFRARHHSCKLVMASATPCLESFARAFKGVYQLVSMPARVAKSMPRMELIDMKTQRSHGGLSITLIDKIQRTLERKEKVILLLNRRGYIPTMVCTACHEALVCEDCGIPLSYHKEQNALICHVCSRQYPVLQKCPHCHESKWSLSGLGTERLEENLHALFPSAVIVRMDADSTRAKNAHAQLLSEFESEGDILVGTQMVAKGLDFEKVTLVGVLSGDASLMRADYRASESTMQMLEQAAGRAGRGRYEGQVCIQTFNPDHYVMQALVRHNYEAFFRQEMHYRHLGKYPPYVFMATIVFSAAEPMEAWRQCQQGVEFFKSLSVPVYGPLEISMRSKMSRCRLLIKEKNEDALQEHVHAFVAWQKKHLRQAKTEININPMMLEE